MGVYIPYTKLPSAYQEVEYIESSATSPGTYTSSGQYIDTLYTPTPNTKIEIDLQFTNTTAQSRLFGVQTENSSYMTINAYINSSSYFARAMKDGTGNWIATTVAADTNRHLFILDKSGYKIYTNGTQVYSAGNDTTPTKNCNHTLPLLANYIFTDSGTTYNKICRHASAKLYSCKIYENEDLVRDFVPCYRKSDNVIGLYDLANSVFYTNSGSGTFSKGNDVVMPELKNAYIGEYVWQPGANTYIYYPLTSDLKDVMGNGNTGTMHGTCTFNNSTGIHVTGKSSNYVTGLSNGVAGRNKFTMNVWLKLDSTGASQQIIGYNNSTAGNQCLYIAFEGAGYRGCAFFGNSWDYTSIGYFTEDTNWHNACLLATGTSYQWYIDGVAYGTATSSSNNMNNYSEMQLGWGGAYGSGKSANGYIKDYIVETVAWTPTQIADYYNKTKSNYGL